MRIKIIIVEFYEYNEFIEDISELVDASSDELVLDESTDEASDSLAGIEDSTSIMSLIFDIRTFSFILSLLK